MKISDALQRYKYSLLAKENVVSVGEGYKVTGGVISYKPAIICGVTKKLSEGIIATTNPNALVPKKIKGIPTDVIETGLLRVGPLDIEHKGFHRPAFCGISVGHKDITAGTLGLWVMGIDNVMYLLSNNHVLANSNDADLGDSILQPGPYDGGSIANPDHVLAYLAQYVPLDFGGSSIPQPPAECATSALFVRVVNAFVKMIGSGVRLTAVRPNAATPNLVDAAIAKPVRITDVDTNIAGVGNPIGITKATLGMAITKSGRTTAVTYGSIDQVNVTAQVSYGGNKVAVFEDQLIAGAISASGDSGSAVLTADKSVVGLLFAGSETTTLINRIEHVFDKLHIKSIYISSTSV